MILGIIQVLTLVILIADLILIMKHCKPKSPTPLKVKKLYPDAHLPRRSSDGDAGYDLYAHNAPEQNLAYTNLGDGTVVTEIMIGAHSSVMIGTGVSMEIPSGYFGGVFARSGLACKQNLRPSNCVGIVDSPFRNEVMVSLYNDSDETKSVRVGDRIAQMVILPYGKNPVIEVEELSETDRGGGFGSSGR